MAKFWGKQKQTLTFSLESFNFIVIFSGPNYRAGRHRQEVEHSRPRLLLRLLHGKSETADASAGTG